MNKEKLRRVFSFIGNMHTILKENKIGDWEIKYKIATKEDCELEDRRVNSFLNFGAYYGLQEGIYTYLLDSGEQVMSDTKTELLTNWHFLQEARGKVLIGGLGLGIMPRILLSKEFNVKEILIVEKSLDVIELVGKDLISIFPDRIKIYHEDIFKFKTNDLFNTIYMDIHSDLTINEFEELDYLENKFRYNLNLNGKIFSWRQL